MSFLIPKVTVLFSLSLSLSLSLIQNYRNLSNIQFSHKWLRCTIATFVFICMAMGPLQQPSYHNVRYRVTYIPMIYCKKKRKCHKRKIPGSSGCHSWHHSPNIWLIFPIKQFQFQTYKGSILFYFYFLFFFQNTCILSILIICLYYFI